MNATAGYISWFKLRKLVCVLRGLHICDHHAVRPGRQLVPMPLLNLLGSRPEVLKVAPRHLTVPPWLVSSPTHMRAGQTRTHDGDWPFKKKSTLCFTQQ